MSSPRRIFVALSALAAIAGLTACGSSSSDVGSAQQVLKQTFGPNKPLKSGKLALQVQFNSQGLTGIGGPINLSLTGPFQSHGGKTLPSFDFDLVLGIAGASFNAGAVSTGTTGYVKLEGTTYRLSDGFFSSFEKGYEQAVSKSGAKTSSGISLQSLGVDPRRWLRSPSKVGTEKVGGADTTHVTAQVDVPKLLTDVDTLLSKADKLGPASAVGVPLTLSAKTRAAIEQAVKSATLDVWSAVSDGAMRRLLVKVGFVVPKAVRSSIGGLQQGNLSVNLQFSDVNKGQKIAAPAAAHPMSELTNTIKQLFGGLLGRVGTRKSSSGSGTAAPNSKYLSCLTAAGSDITKVQACANLLAK